MKAAINRSYGAPEKVIKVEGTAKPSLKRSEVLIKVYASSVNRTDCGFLRAKPSIVRLFSGLTRPKNTILGCEFAGKVVAIGRNVSLYKINDKVFGFNDSSFGGHGEYAVMPEKASMTTMIDTQTYKEAAVSTEGSHYALYFMRAAKVGKNSRLIINGATGGIGSAAVQLAKYYGAHVTAISDTNNMKLIKNLGADKVIDRNIEDFTLLNEKFDIVLDAVGKSSFKDCKPILKPGGIYISSELGRYGQNPLLALWTKFFGKHRVLFPIPLSKQEDIVFIKKLIAEGKFNPVIDRTYTLDQIVEAYKYVEKGQKTGNVVISVVT